MKWIFDSLFNGLAILFSGYIVIWNIARIIYFFKCSRVKKCSDKRCFLKDTCDKYAPVWTKEDMEKLYELIDSLDE